MVNPIEIAKDILKSEADAIYHLMDNLDSSFQKAVDLIMNCKGRLLIFGIGKSGHIGKKMAATFASTGQPSFFIHPTEAIHGDLGMVVKGDVGLLISNSGNSEELLEIIPALKRVGIPIIAMTSTRKSKLASFSDVILDTLVTKEACPLNLAPTTSTTVSLAYGDAIAMTLLQLRGIKEEEFALNHPGGSLGKRLLVKVCDIMRTDNIPINHYNDSFKDVLKTVSHYGLGTTCIVDDNQQLLGIITDGDIRRLFERYDRVSNIKVRDIYTKDPKTISENILAMEAIKIMEDNKITSLVVVNEGKRIIGLLHIHHLLENGFY